MAEQTGISWADATFNPWVGCAKVSPGCAHCYAETLVTGRMGRAGTWGEDGVRQRTTTANWRKPLSWAKTMPAQLGRRPRVFCASLADVFEPRPELDAWRRDLFALIEETPELDWLVLTKRPDYAATWLRDWNFRAWESLAEGPLLPNLWMGTSIENSRFTWRADALREIPAAVRFISAEPLLGSLFEDRAPRPGTSDGTPASEREPTEGSVAPAGRAPLDLSDIDWVIVGGESGGRTARPPHPGWVREIAEACDRFDYIGPDPNDMNGEAWGRRGPALHFKQWGSWRPARDDEDVLRAPPGDLHYFPDGVVMRYAGSSPGSGGKLLDGVDWCEFPQYDPVPA